MKVAIVYDRVNKFGGAERVLLSLHEIFPDAPLFTSVYSKEDAKWADVFPQVIPSFLQKIPFAKKHHELFAPIMPFVFESHKFDDYDLVISVTSEFAKGIITTESTKHVCYLLTPTRYLWSGHETYFENRLLRKLTKPVVKHLKKWDKTAASRPDIIIAISTVVQERIKKYYKLDTKIIFPPVKRLSASKNKKNKKEYFLLVSRLVSYKKVDLAIEAFNELKLPLVIVGTGNKEKKLKRMAKRNISFVGFVTDNELSRYYSNAKALIFPQIEDFGITAIEAQSFGVPVIAFKGGGALDFVTEETGVFFEEQTKECLVKAIKKFSGITFDGKKIKRNAERFSEKRFKKEFLELVNSL